jgi:hypothetical protein
MQRSGGVIKWIAFHLQAVQDRMKRRPCALAAVNPGLSMLMFKGKQQYFAAALGYMRLINNLLPPNDSRWISL